MPKSSLANNYEAQYGLYTILICIAIFVFKGCSSERQLDEGCRILDGYLDDKEGWALVQKAADRGNKTAQLLIKDYEHIKYMKRIHRERDAEEAAEELSSRIFDIANPGIDY